MELPITYNFLLVILKKSIFNSKLPTGLVYYLNNIYKYIIKKGIILTSNKYLYNNIIKVIN